MPIYEFLCKCGHKFEVLHSHFTEKLDFAQCPKCGRLAPRIPSVPARTIFRESKENLPLGNKSRGRLLTAEETGGSPILIPSWGALEKEEIDYIAEAAIEKEKTRKRDSVNKRRLERITEIVKQAPSGQRGLTARELIKEGV